MSNSRLSNIELVRIIAISMILLLHVVGHGYKAEGWSVNFAMIGVNLFVLISGYFGINFKWKSVLNLIFTVYFYILIDFAIDYFYVRPDNFNWKSYILFSPHFKYWFISVYLELYLVAPLLNAGLRGFNDRQYIVFLAFLLFISCVAGWILHAEVNPNGYTLMQFVLIYIIGYGIRRFRVSGRLKQRYWLLIFVVCSFLSFFRVAYNSPIVILSAVSVFCFCSESHFQSRAVNYISSCVLGAYLLQDGRVGWDYTYPLLNGWYEKTLQFSPPYTIILYTVFIVTLYIIAACLIDSIRKIVVARPLACLSKVIVKYKLDIFR